MSDYRMQQQVEEERMALAMEVLKRVAQGMSTQADARFLASELGLPKWSIDDERKPKNPASEQQLV